MPDDDEFIQTGPRVTGNSVLLLGYISAAFHNTAERLGEETPYEVDEVYPSDGYMIVEHTSGNRYRVSVEQISGIE
jgi:hypothetical protein